MTEPMRNRSYTDRTTRRLQRMIRNAEGNCSMPTEFQGMTFVRYVRMGRGADADFAWSIYISHDPCHDHDDYEANRNTVVAFHHSNGTFRILGRELPRQMAWDLARGMI